jgi:hypothetical protein
MHGQHFALKRLVTFCTLNHADGVACLKLCATYNENSVSSDSVEEAKNIGRPEYVMLCTGFDYLHHVLRVYVFSPSFDDVHFKSGRMISQNHMQSVAT